MNISNIINEIAKTDPEVYERVSGRRNLLKSFGSKVAVSAIPLALGSLFKKAYGQTTASASLLASMNYALQIEYFTYNFYHTGNNTGGLVSAADIAGLQAIENHDLGHINFLKNLITTMGGTPYTPKNYIGNPFIASGAYDFTKSGTFTNVFTSYAIYLDLGQAFKDLAVRAYKGIVGSNGAGSSFIGTAMQIHSVEARHAAHVRYVRRNSGAIDNPKPWVSENISFQTAPLNQFIPFYINENNILQGTNIDITTLAGANGSTISHTAATEAFDEPLDMTTVQGLISPFILT